MYHTRFCGTHYEIGKTYGSALRKNGKFILEQVPWPIGPEQTAFAAACRPFYETYFPEILEEIRGLADGQECQTQQLEALLFSMYCVVPACRCSHFAVRNKKHVLFGRNSDFLTSIEKFYTNSIYHFKNDSHSFTGNTTAFIQMEDGVNEHGLAVGLTMVPSGIIQPGINAGMILRMILEKCTSVQETWELLKKLPIASSQTFLLADRQRIIALAECGPLQMEFLCPQEEEAWVCATNRFHTDAMRSFNDDSIDNWQAEDRYWTLCRTLQARVSDFTPEDAKDLLAGKNGFICQYDRRTGKDTVWSILYDADSRCLFRTEGNPSRRKYQEDRRFFIHERKQNEF